MAIEKKLGSVIYVLLILLVTVVIGGCNRRVDLEEVSMANFDIGDFNLEENFEAIQGLIEEAIDIGNVTKTEEIRRFQRIVVLRVTNEENRVYRVQLLVEGAEKFFIWDIEDDTREYIYIAYEESFNIIQEASGFEDGRVSGVILTARDFLNVTSIIRAELREEENVFEFECANNRVFLLDISPNSRGAIRSAETGEIVFAVYSELIFE